MVPSFKNQPSDLWNKFIALFLLDKNTDLKLIKAFVKVLKFV